MRKTTETLNQDSWSRGQNLNPRHVNDSSAVFRINVWISQTKKAKQRSENEKRARRQKDGMTQEPLINFTLIRQQWAMPRDWWLIVTFILYHFWMWTRKQELRIKHKAASWYDVGNEIITAVSCRRQGRTILLCFRKHGMNKQSEINNTIWCQSWLWKS